MGDSGVYNSTTISYENSGGGLSLSPSGQRRPWSLSEVVSPPQTRSRWFHWMLLMGGSIVLGLGLIVTIIGIYNQHYYSPEANNVLKPNDETPSHWLVTVMGLSLVFLGIILLAIYCKLVNTNRILCNPLSRTRNALRQVVTKPRFQNGPSSGGGNLLVNEAALNRLSTHQYDPASAKGYHQTNGDVSSEEKAKLMAHEVKEGSISETSAQRHVYRPFVHRDRSPSPVPPQPPQRPLRQQFSSLRRNNPAASQPDSHYKSRHFAGHGYGQGRLPSSLASPTNAPLASIEDITPSLRSSFASVMMYPPSDWGNSDNDSVDSTIFVNLPPSNLDDDDDDETGCEPIRSTRRNRNHSLDFRISPIPRRGSSLSSLSVHSAFP